MLSHELRNPLTTIDAAAQLLALAHGTDPSVSALAGRIRRGGARAQHFLQNCLTGERIAADRLTLNRRPVDLAHLVRAVLGAAEPARPRRLRLEAPAVLPNLDADPDLLEVLPINLLENALILDLGLPGEDGLTLAAHVRDLPGLAVIMLSARDQVQDRLEALAANFSRASPASLKRVAFSAANGFNASMFRIDGSGFQNTTDGGTWGVSAGSGGLYLSFAPADAPEPASLALLALGAGLLAARRRRAGALR